MEDDIVYKDVDETTSERIATCFKVFSRVVYYQQYGPN